MNFKKLTFIISIVIASTLVVGCSSKIEKDAMKQGKDAIASSNYAEAIKVFDFALQNDSNNEEAKQLQNLSSTYLKAEQAFKEVNYKECEEFVKDLENNTNKKLISADLEKLKKSLSEVNSNNSKEFSNSIKEAETLINSGKFNEAKKVLNKVKDEEIAKNHIEKINLLLSKANEGIKGKNKKVQEEEEQKLTSEEAMSLLKNKVKLSQDQYYKLSSKDYYILENGSQAYVINKYYKPKSSTKDQLISQYYIDVLNGNIIEEIAGIKKEIN